MYHLGKVVKTFGDAKDQRGMQATIEMWDENIMTFEVDGSIAKEIKEDTFVLVDYRPLPNMTMPAPKHMVMRVLTKSEGAAVWEKYREHFNKLKQGAQPGTIAPQGQYG